jgi:hypothetical protein
MNVPASITPYKPSKHSKTAILDADGRVIASIIGENEQAMATKELFLDSVNFMTEAESLAQTDVRVAAAYKELRDAVEATRGIGDPEEVAA